MGVRELRTGLSWADWHRPNATAWFDRRMHKLEDFDVTLTFCFTPPSVGRRPCHTSSPVDPAEFTRFAVQVVQRYVLGEIRSEKTGPIGPIAPNDRGERNSYEQDQDRGVKLDATYQPNTGGNADFLNMLDRSRLSSKKTSKTEAVQSQLAERPDDEHIHIGPSDVDDAAPVGVKHLAGHV